nr:MAG TPA: hypothetical protein [Microviridae sp.]
MIKIRIIIQASLFVKIKKDYPNLNFGIVFYNN